MKKVICFIDKGDTYPRTRQEQRDAVFRAARRYLPHVVAWVSPRGNAPLWMVLPLGIDPEELLRLSRQEGVVFVPGPMAHDERNTAILHFSHLEPNDIEEGIRRLGGLIVRYMDYASRANGTPSFHFIGP